MRRQLPEAASAYYIGTTKWPVLRPELPHNCTKKLIPVLHLPKVSVQEGQTRLLFDLLHLIREVIVLA